MNPSILEKISAILDGDSEALVNFAEELGSKYAPQDRGELKQKVTSSQIRNILDDVQRMKKYDRNALLLLRPKLAYAAGKSFNNNSLKQLQEILDKAIELTVQDPQKAEHRFSNFKNFFEAIVGYHRYHSKVREG